MTLFKKDNKTKDIKKNDTEEITENVEPEAEQEEVTLDDIILLLYGIAKKVGALPDDLADDNDDEDDDDDDDEDDDDEEEEIIETEETKVNNDDLLADKPKSNKTESEQDRYEKNTNGGSSIDRFLLSKGLTLDEIKKVENYYSEPEVKQNEAKGQSVNTDDKELEEKVLKNDPNRVKLNSITSKQEEKIIKKNSAEPEVMKKS
jgi:hypothetical protein